MRVLALYAVDLPPGAAPAPRMLTAGELSVITRRVHWPTLPPDNTLDYHQLTCPCQGVTPGGQVVPNLLLVPDRRTTDTRGVTMGAVLRRPATTPLAATALMVLLILLFGVLLTTPWRPAEALAPASGPSVSQCNDQADAGATTTTCDITITNIITYNADGTSTTAATIVKTVDGVATTTTATAPITEIHQCNQAGKGGASTVTCTSTITNMITGAPASNPAASTINQCNPAMAPPPLVRRHRRGRTPRAGTSR